MAMNIGYLGCDCSAAGDEVYTPYYAVAPLLNYIPKNYKIWCPFDEEWSAFYNTFKKNKYDVVATSTNFFETKTPDGVDIVVSNPPFSKKDNVLEECLIRKLPFVFLLPVQTLQGINRYKKVFSTLSSLQLLGFDKRVGFHTKHDMLNFSLGNHFASFYFIGNIKLLPDDIIIRELQVFQKPLIEGDNKSFNKKTEFCDTQKTPSIFQMKLDL